MWRMFASGVPADDVRSDSDAAAPWEDDDSSTEVEDEVAAVAMPLERKKDL